MQELGFSWFTNYSEFCPQSFEMFFVVVGVMMGILVAETHEVSGKRFVSTCVVYALVARFYCFRCYNILFSISNS